MPELPEVQTIVNELNEKVKEKIIEDAWTDKENLIRNVSFTKFKKKITGKKIIEAKRRAKYIIIELSEGYVLLVHLKMTGHFLLGKWEIENNKVKAIVEGPIKEDKYNDYIHIIFYLNTGEELAFSDLRQFGRIELYTKEEFANLKEINNLGIEPLGEEFTLKRFENIVKSSKTNIKKLLMDQEKIAGIGNIYASEILFQAKVNPKRNTSTLEDNEIKNIHNSIFAILNKALELKGDSMSDYRRTGGEKGDYQNYAKVYEKKGQKCPDCEGIIEYAKINQRGTYYCPKCQK
ncbi:MAG: bifunctional DNA-formamidopyrimidine glycosylase/DNA-(apurinic or apyrimidinic site) lyase [Candidatus Pacebacteria bacterium]|nr:bifunctional DNA-formamidopyrimidine glycosylase/DNA-(apurinic or apyrimidinic site) lyase [Candidatus Paceibacterota bacterium]